MRASAGSGVTYQAPYLGQPDTFRLSAFEKYAGPQAYTRAHRSYAPATADFAANLWREPVPFNLSSDYGMAIAYSSAAVWLATPSGVWTATLVVPSLDVPADVLEASTADAPFEGRLRLVLRNDDGRYSTLPAAIKTAAEVRVSPGYVTSSGPLASDGPAYWIERIERVSGAGQAALVLEGRDAWGLLAGWRSRRQYTWAAGEKNVFGLLQYLFARAGLEFSSSGSSGEATSLYPAFTVSPGVSGLAAVQHLLAMLPDVMFVRGEFGFLREPLASEAAVYAYGTQTGAADHALLSARSPDVLAGANRGQGVGKGGVGERFDWTGGESAHDR